MSAIFGILDLNGRQIDPAWISSMQEDLIHRGPDGQGLYREDSLVLGNMLLQVTPESVYDKSLYEEDGLVITANARMDERDELMDKLNIDHAAREKITDPILLLRSYKKWGKDFVKDIYGDFSFAIWDKEKKELFCARDHMGVKPFLYYLQDNRFVFSTEIKAIVRLPFVKTEIDHLYHRDLAIGILDFPDRTTWKNITRLRAASTILIKGADYSINQFWEPVYKRNAEFKTIEKTALELQKLLIKVISDHTRVIGTFGVPLSGGLDSGTIACVAAKNLAKQGKRFYTVSSVLDPLFNDPEIKDERDYIQMILQQEKNIDPSFVLHSNLGLLNDVEEKFNKQYAPVNYFHYIDDAINNQFKLKSVRRVLSGYLGDITVSNSTIYPLSHLLLSGRFYQFFKLSHRLKKNSGKKLVPFISSQIVVPMLPMFLLKLWHRLKGYEIPWEYINKLPLNFTAQEKVLVQKRITKYYKGYLNYQHDPSRNIWPTPWENFGEDFDCGSSHHQIEMTYPLLDRRLVEFLLQVPVEHFNADGLPRGLIRKAMDGILPEKNRSRKDKYPYSPGHHQIIKKDILNVNALLLNEKLKDEMENMIDEAKMTKAVENLVESKTSLNFEGDYWSIMCISMWILFENWSLNKIKSL